MTEPSGSQTRWGRHTAFTNGKLFGQRLATQGLYPLTRIRIGHDRLDVRSIVSQADWSLARPEVSLVAPVPDGHRMSFRSVGFLLIAGGAWELMLGPPEKLMDDLERFGWPVDRDAVVSWNDVAGNVHASGR